MISPVVLFIWVAVLDTRPDQNRTLFGHDSEIEQGKVRSPTRFHIIQVEENSKNTNSTLSLLLIPARLIGEEKAGGMTGQSVAKLGCYLRNVVMVLSISWVNREEGIRLLAKSTSSHVTLPF